ncbi:MAG TPA: TIM barrel protein [Chthoniobacteraceae bacterium]|jgi:inosose dehydratase
MNRRAFLKQSSAAVAACGLLPHLARSAETAKPLVGTQIYGWGQYYEREGKSVWAHLGEVLSPIRDAGYDYVEGFLNAKPEANLQFAEQLKSKGLKPVALYTGGSLHDAATADEKVAQLLASAKAAAEGGFSVINCNPEAVGRGKTDAELEIQGKSLQTLGDELNMLGLKLGIHNHTPEMVNGAREFHANFKGTDPKTVGFCYDVHWVYRGGVQPAEALAAYGERIVSWHLRQSRDEIWWEDLDTGDVDYGFIANYAREHRLPQVFTVELALESGTKITRSVVENHARSREFIRRVFEV